MLFVPGCTFHPPTVERSNCPACQHGTSASHWAFPSFWRLRHFDVTRAASFDYLMPYPALKVALWCTRGPYQAFRMKTFTREAWSTVLITPNGDISSVCFMKMEKDDLRSEGNVFGAQEKSLPFIVMGYSWVTVIDEIFICLASVKAVKLLCGVMLKTWIYSAQSWQCSCFHMYPYQPYWNLHNMEIISRDDLSFYIRRRRH